MATRISSVSQARCPLCAQPGKKPRAPFGTRWDDRQFDFVNCEGCGSQFMDPMPSPADFQRIYTQEAYHDEHYAELMDVPKQSLEALQPFVRSGSRLLDFGCGNGRFLRAAAAAGYRAHGVELDETTRTQAAKNSGCDVLGLDELVSRDLKYEVIHLGDVLEHLPDPIDVMGRLRAALTPGGVFLLEGPLEENRSLVSWSAALVRRAKTALGRSTYAGRAPTHLTRTTAASQRRFFKSGLGHEMLHFEVWEDGWPYLPTGSNGAGSTNVRTLIGRTAVAMAAVANAAGLEFGNRFIAVTRPAARN